MSDFMISDAALAMRMQEMQQEQSADFAALLDGFDSTESAAVKPGQAGQVNQPKQAQTEQAKAEEIPEESADGTAVKTEKAPEKLVDAEEDAEDDNKPAVKDTTTEQMTFAALHAVEIDSEISAEFEEITASLAESADKEIAPVFLVDEDAEITTPVQQTVPEEIVQVGTADNVEVPQAANTQNDELIPPELAEILKPVEEADKPVEQIPEKDDVADDAVVAETVVSEAVNADEEIEVKAKQEAPEKAQAVKAEESEEPTFTAEAPAEITAQVAETTVKPDIEPTAEVRTETGLSGVEAVTDERAAAAEANYPVRGTANAQTESENNGNSGNDAAGSEKGFEVFQGAVEKGEISTPEVRTVTREVPAKAEQSEEKAEILQPVRIEQPEEQPHAQRMTDGKTNSVTEELEMLKNAKAKSSQNNQTREKPMVSSESPLTTDTPITLTRANGERVEVRPSEIIEQATAKLVETAQTMKEQATEYSLVLNPEELGKIVVKLVKAADGAVSVSIAAENTRTQRILEQHSAAMQENLRDSGVKLEGWQMVRESEQETYAQDYNGSSKNPYYREEDHSQGEQQESEQTSFADLIASM